MNLELNIEELVLDGFPGIDKDRLSRVLHLELERLFTEEGVPASIQAGGTWPVWMEGARERIMERAPSRWERRWRGRSTGG